MAALFATGCGACIDTPLFFSRASAERTWPTKGPRFNLGLGTYTYLDKAELEHRLTTELGYGFGSERVRGLLGLEAGGLLWYNDCDSSYSLWPIGNATASLGFNFGGFKAGAYLWAGTLFLGGGLRLGLGEPEFLTLSAGTDGLGLTWRFGRATLGLGLDSPLAWDEDPALWARLGLEFP